MVADLFRKQKELLDYFFAKVDVNACEKFISKVQSCEGVIFLTGIGKSGFVAQKVATTLMSTGSRSFYLSPIDALHGDVGMVGSKDCLIAISKSGETEELLQLLPVIRNKAAAIFCVTSNRLSRLAKGSDCFVELPCKEELCPFDLAPTISTEIQLMFGDILAIHLMQKKGFSLEKFAENHPAGRIGRRASIKVRDLMLQMEKTPLCSIKDTLESVLVDFTNKRCGCLVIIDEERRLKGIFTDGDLRRALQHKGEKVLKERLGDLMTSKPSSIDADASAWEAVKLMEEDQKRPIMVLPVVEKEQVVGLIKMHDIIQAGL